MKTKKKREKKLKEYYESDKFYVDLIWIEAIKTKKVTCMRARLYRNLIYDVYIKN